MRKACLGVIAVAGLSACGPAAPAPLPEELAVSVKQYRLDYAPRALEVAVSNGGDDTVRILRASFRWPGFTGAATWDRATDVPPGSTRDLRVLLGEPVCGADTGSPPSVTIDLVEADGTAAHGAVAPADPLGTLARVHSEDCLAERFGAAATVTAGPKLRVETRGDIPVALLDVTATPVPGAAAGARVASIGRTILVRPADGSEEWVLGWELGGESGAHTATLAIVPNNCNPHSVAEDKRGTYFPAAVTVDATTSGTVFVPVSTGVRAEIYAYIAAYCGW